MCSSAVSSITHRTLHSVFTGEHRIWGHFQLSHAGDTFGSKCPVLFPVDSCSRSKNCTLHGIVSFIIIIIFSTEIVIYFSSVLLPLWWSSSSTALSPVGFMEEQSQVKLSTNDKAQRTVVDFSKRFSISWCTSCTFFTLPALVTAVHVVAEVSSPGATVVKPGVLLLRDFYLLGVIIVWC